MSTSGAPSYIKALLVAALVVLFLLILPYVIELLNGYDSFEAEADRVRVSPFVAPYLDANSQNNQTYHSSDYLSMDEVYGNEILAFEPVGCRTYKRSYIATTPPSYLIPPTLRDADSNVYKVDQTVPIGDHNNLTIRVISVGTPTPTHPGKGEFLATRHFSPDGSLLNLDKQDFLPTDPNVYSHFGLSPVVRVTFELASTEEPPYDLIQNFLLHDARTGWPYYGYYYETFSGINPGTSTSILPQWTWRGNYLDVTFPWAPWHQGPMEIHFLSKLNQHLVWRLNSIPGLPPENGNLDDLQDARIPFVLVRNPVEQAAFLTNALQAHVTPTDWPPKFFFPRPYLMIPKETRTNWPSRLAEATPREEFWSYRRGLPRRHAVLSFNNELAFSPPGAADEPDTLAVVNLPPLRSILRFLLLLFLVPIAWIAIQLVSASQLLCVLRTRRYETITIWQARFLLRKLGRAAWQIPERDAAAAIPGVDVDNMDSLVSLMKRGWSSVTAGQ